MRKNSRKNEKMRTSLCYGGLDENLTTRGIDHRQMRAGHRYRIAEAFVEAI